MSASNDTGKVWCECCQQEIPRTRERAHRKAAKNLLLVGDAGPPPKRLRRSGYGLNEHEPSDSQAPSPEPLAPLVSPVPMQLDDNREHSPEPANALPEPIVSGPPPVIDAIDADGNMPTTFARRRWDQRARVEDEVPSDSEDEDDTPDQGPVPVEDDPYNDELDEEIDWDELTEGLDELAENYEARCAQIANKLEAYDRAICRAFAYKLTTHTPDTAWKKAPHAFHTDPPLPKLPELRSRTAFLSGFKPELYDCCPNSCLCYAGPNDDLQECTYCHTSRYRADGKPRKRFTYIPVIPRLLAFLSNVAIATLLLYRAKYKSKPGVSGDVFDGEGYHSLKEEHVKLGDKTFRHKYFEDDRDIALGLSTDGFAPFNKRKSTAWPLILFLYNLPPDLRFLVANILALGVIPGPKKPQDFDSFIWPFLQELFRLLQGVQAYDILKEELFRLRAFLILVFGDIPAVSMVMRMKGHNGFSPCRMCEIHGLRVPNSRATTHYVPLDQSPHPDVNGDPQRIRKYDPRNLPLRTHDSLLTQAMEVDSATTITAAEALSKSYGIKGTPALSYLHSLSFPRSFPYDFMHLIWENTINNLILHWTGTFKGLDDGQEAYTISSAIWEVIGAATHESGSTIPSAYGARVPNIIEDRTACTADMWSFWTQYIGPVLLHRRFQNQKYYRHFIDLVRLLTICLQFEITDEEIETVRDGFIAWVQKYEDYYYQHDASRLSTCPVTIHALLHIADSIKFCGPVWCYWAFPMERYCNRLKPSIRSRRFPYAAMDRYVTEDAQLTQIKAIYDGMAEELALRAPREDPPRGSFADPAYEDFRFLCPRVVRTFDLLDAGLSNAICAAIATRFTLPVSKIRPYLRTARIEEWGKVCQIDSEEGDTIHSSAMVRNTADRRDATFVRYEMLVDKYERQIRRQPVFTLETFYGQVEHFFAINFTCDDPAVAPEKPIWLAAIRNCKTVSAGMADLEALDIHPYNSMGSLNICDLTCVLALVGRVKYPLSNAEFAIIDRSGKLARAEHDRDEESDDEER